MRHTWYTIQLTSPQVKLKYTLQAAKITQHTLRINYQTSMSKHSDNQHGGTMECSWKWEKWTELWEQNKNPLRCSMDPRDPAWTNVLEASECLIPPPPALSMSRIMWSVAWEQRQSGWEGKDLLLRVDHCPTTKSHAETMQTLRMKISWCVMVSLMQTLRCFPNINFGNHIFNRE